jgi:hypothetical protein
MAVFKTGYSEFVTAVVCLALVIASLFVKPSFFRVHFKYFAGGFLLLIALYSILRWYPGKKG